eukprot:TRINITY_DN59580_c0_g1_i6.p1 TRINITY_DN59580_c0_g1~~TRINITY_DN59580_c0_g1_i6.p1  ORF type:complete len:586 (-),score=111.27 TRINITY_DN59580_c0_g1_i6:279-1970(-)
MELTCRWCGSGFTSRNKLFSHVRSTPECAAAAAAEDERATDVLAEGNKPSFAAFRIGYPSDAGSVERQLAAAMTAAGAKRLALQRASAGNLGDVPRQEASCGAVCDVFSANFSSPVTAQVVLQRLQESLTKTADACNGSSCKRLGGSGVESSSASTNGTSRCSCQHDPAEDAKLRMFEAVELPSGRAFNMETLCTQRSYCYMLPLRALGVEALAPVDEGSVVYNDKGRAQVAAWAEDGRRKEVYRKLKAALRSALQAGPDGEVVVANAGPRPAKRHWHSFAPPEYAGDLDPKVAAVQGILDKLQHADTVTMSGEEFAVLRVAGDRFLPQQVRRLVATALCVQRGWLPSDFFLTATRPDVVVSTPVAPEGLLYLEECKFTFWEYRHGPLFAAGSCEGSKDWTASLQRRIAARWAAEDGVGKFEAWLQHMEKVDVPRIRAQLERIRMADAFANGDWRPPKPLHDCAGFPGAYEECLRLLREVHASGRWPESSLARGKLIRPGEGGSFSVGQTGEQQKVPKGNLAFPELTRAVFELERLIAPAGRVPGLVSRKASSWALVHTLEAN